MNIYDRRSPVLNDLAAVLRAAGKTDKMIAEKARLSKTTVNNFLTGKTRSPHFKTIEFMLEATGQVLVPVDEGQRKPLLRRVK